jgi:TonB family protein
VHKVDAIYPEEAKRKGVQGEVVLEISIDEKGKVTGARVKSGPEPLHQAAVDAVKQFRFENSLETKVLATVTFNFVLGGKDDREKPKKPQM